MVSPFSVVFPLLHQQAAPIANIKDYHAQACDFRGIQTREVMISFPRPTDAATHALLISLLFDSGHSAINGNLFHVTEMLLGDLLKDSIFDVGFHMSPNTPFTESKPLRYSLRARIWTKARS